MTPRERLRHLWARLVGLVLYYPCRIWWSWSRFDRARGNLPRPEYLRTANRLARQRQLAQLLARDILLRHYRAMAQPAGDERLRRLRLAQEAQEAQEKMARAITPASDGVSDAGSSNDHTGTPARRGFEPRPTYSVNAAGEVRFLQPNSDVAVPEKKEEKTRTGILRPTPPLASGAPPAKEWNPDEYDFDSDDSRDCHIISCKVSEMKKKEKKKAPKEVKAASGATATAPFGPERLSPAECAAEIAECEARIQALEASLGLKPGEEVTSQPPSSSSSSCSAAAPTANEDWSSWRTPPERAFFVANTAWEEDWSWADWRTEEEKQAAEAVEAGNRRSWCCCACGEAQDSSHPLNGCIECARPMCALCFSVGRLGGICPRCRERRDRR